ncbi:MAG: hypothetical protein JW857_10400 [Bacteroidales bacterium]|nr:hypothetical protein [Bacteroidales bacterium]
MRYIITGKTNASVVLEFDENELLRFIEFKENTLKQLNFMLSNLPAMESELESFVVLHKLKLNRVQQDLSFESFWNAYKYKVGKKARTERLWNSLDKLERELVFIAIPKYHRFISSKNQESAYAETWLNNRMWENEYHLK